MITLRKSEERRHIASENQKTWMTFDWENQNDPLRDGFGALKIFNEEILNPGRVFTLQTQQDMVVVTYVNEGVMIFNRPQKGKSGVLETGEFHQDVTTAGLKQFAHNASPTDSARLFQSVFTHGTKLPQPGGEKKRFTLAERRGILKLIASPDGKDNSLKIQQDVEMYSTLIQKGNHMIHELRPGRKAWLHVVKGQIDLSGLLLHAGDGAGFTDETAVSFTAQEPTEILLFDLCVPIPGETPSEAWNPSETASPVKVS
jgi:redox-sensitive bicupin YhaK (pirin superfamily)